MAKIGSKKVKTAKPILLGVLKRAIPVAKDGDFAMVRFSISENGNLVVSSDSRENGSTTEEISEALVIKPGGPGLTVGDFGVVNLSSDPVDFEIDALHLLQAVKQAKSDPTIIFHGQDKPIEFSFSALHHVFLVNRRQLV